MCLCVSVRHCSQWWRVYCVSVKSSSSSTTGRHSWHSVWLSYETVTQQPQESLWNHSSDCSGISLALTLWYCWKKYSVRHLLTCLHTCMCLNDIPPSYSLAHSHDTNDTLKVMGSKVKVRQWQPWKSCALASFWTTEGSWTKHTKILGTLGLRTR